MIINYLFFLILVILNLKVYASCYDGLGAAAAAAEVEKALLPDDDDDDGTQEWMYVNSMKANCAGVHHSCMRKEIPSCGTPTPAQKMPNGSNRS